MQPNTPVTTQPNASFDKQLADIKSRAAQIVSKAQKIDPNIKISAANAEMIGLPKVQIPTTKTTPPRPTELDRVGTTPVPKTSQDVARETILSQVPEADRDTIDQILGIATGYQTEKGRALESTAESLMTQQLSNIQSIRDRKLDTSKMEQDFNSASMKAEIESIREEADVLKATKQNAIQSEMAREGVSTGSQSGNVQRITRDFDLQMGNLAIRELAAVGKMNAASRMIENMMDLKYGDLEAETALLTAQINAISPFLNREDQKAAETRLQLNDIVKSKIAEARESDKALEEFKLQSYIFAQQNGATPATLSQIMSSTSREDVASVGGTFIQDPLQKLQMQAQRESILTSQTTRANANRRQTSIVEINGEQTLIDSQTGETIKVLSGGDAPTDTLARAVASENINQVNNLLSSKGLSSSVGPSALARTEPGLWGATKRFFSGALTGALAGGVTGAAFGGVGAIPGAIVGALGGGVVNAVRGSMTELTGEKQNFIAGVEKMIEGLTFDALARAKGEGVTFGSLTEPERAAVAAAASKIATWRMKSGNDVIGYNASEADFKREVDTINNFKKLDEILKGATPESVGAVVQPDGTVWALNSDGTYTQLR